MDLANVIPRTVKCPPHIEVAVENRLAAQKALLIVYGRQKTGIYPNGIRLRCALQIGAAYNLNTKAKLEKVRSRQQLWSRKKSIRFQSRRIPHSLSCLHPNHVYNSQKISSVPLSRQIKWQNVWHLLLVPPRTGVRDKIDDK